MVAEHVDLSRLREHIDKEVEAVSIAIKCGSRFLEMQVRLVLSDSGARFAGKTSRGGESRAMQETPRWSANVFEALQRAGRGLGGPGGGQGTQSCLGAVFPSAPKAACLHPKTVSVRLLYLVLQSQPEIQVVVNAERSVPLLTGEGRDPGFARMPECMLGSEGGPEGTGWEGRERHPTREGFPDSSRTPNKPHRLRIPRHDVHEYA